MRSEIDIQKKGNMVEIFNIPSENILRAINIRWETKRINKHMFTVTTYKRIILFEFFLLEFVYILKEILQDEELIRLNITRGIFQLIKAIEEKTWVGSINQEHADILDFKRLKNMTFKPLKHQLEFLEQYNTNIPKYQLNGYILAAPPGSGKTYAGLALAQCLEADCMVIVSPKNAIRRVWYNEILQYVKGEHKIWVSDDSGPPPPGMDYYICHYESLERLLGLTSHFAKRNVMIDLDECHNFNEINSQRTQNFIKLCKDSKCNNVLWASGTPIKAIGSEMIGVLHTIDPYFSPHVEKRFKKLFGLSAGSAKDILSHRLGLVTYKIDKSLVVKGKPVIEKLSVAIPNGNDYTLDSIRIDMRAYIEERFIYYDKNKDKFVDDYYKALSLYELTINNPKQAKEFKYYKECVKKISKTTDYYSVLDMMKFANKFEENEIMPLLDRQLKKDFKQSKSFVKYLPLKIRGEALGNVLGKKRAQCHVDMIEHIGLPRIIRQAETKTLIFTSYVEVVEQVEKYLKSQKFKPLTVYGKTNNDLIKIVSKFDKDPKANPLAATIQSLSTAVPLTVANTVIFLNQPFRSYEKDQAISRAHRIGQEHQVFVFDVLLDTGEEPNISTRSEEIMEWSKEQVDILMGTSSPVDMEAFRDTLDEDIFNQVNSVSFEQKNNKVNEIVKGNSTNARLSIW